MKPDLGFIVSGVTPEGKYIVGVDPEGPARDAGLLDGDVIACGVSSGRLVAAASRKADQSRLSAPRYDTPRQRCGRRI